jgi:hypothetical protein
LLSFRFIIEAFYILIALFGVAIVVVIKFWFAISALFTIEVFLLPIFSISLHLTFS